MIFLFSKRLEVGALGKLSKLNIIDVVLIIGENYENN